MSNNNPNPNTQELLNNAIAALCGFTAEAASEENTGSAAAAPVNASVSSPTAPPPTAASMPPRLAAASLLNAQQTQSSPGLQLQQQLQQLQVLEMMRQRQASAQAQAEAASAQERQSQLQALAAQLLVAQHQQQQANSANPSLAALAGMAAAGGQSGPTGSVSSPTLQVPSTAPNISANAAVAVNPSLAALTSMVAAAGGQSVPGTVSSPAPNSMATSELQQQQQQQKQDAQRHQLQSLAAQLLVAQHQQQQANSAAAAANPSLAALTSMAAVGGQSVPPGSVSFPANVGNNIALPPPPKVVLCMPQSTPATDEKRGSPIAQASIPVPAHLPQQAIAAQEQPMQDVISEWEDKKQARRAASQLSTRLSRKRKKIFVENLKTENVELRRKEQVLRSIPDLVIAFDSGGSISLVSDSAARLFGCAKNELEGTSFWDLLAEDSVQLIKAFFMDALAAKRSSNDDSTPLSNGDSLSVKMMHVGGKEEGEGDCFSASLRGAVHHLGESPECVCSIRPDGNGGRTRTSNKKLKPAAEESSSSDSQNEQEQKSRANVSAPSRESSKVDTNSSEKSDSTS